MPASMLVYAYVRMSTAGQIDGDSERRQLADARSWAERNGHTLAPPLKDLGISAFRGSNQRKGAALGAFLNGLKDGKLEPGILYLEAVDRLSREPPMRILSLINEIFDTGTVIHVRSMGATITRENFDTTLFPLLSLMASLAHVESRQKSERITAANRARQERARTGQRSKGAYSPPWFKRVYGENGAVSYEPIPDVVASINRLFDLAATGMGGMSIARMLNAESAAMVPATNVRQTERRWFQAYCGRLLTDRRVLGEYQPTRTEGERLVPIGDPVLNYFDPIITLEQWEAAQAAKDPKLGGRVGGRKMVFSNLFTGGIAKCAHCSGSMLTRAVYKAGTAAKMPYLRCASAQQGLGCKNTKYARLDWFETKVLAALPGIPWRELIRNIPVEDATQAVTVEIEAVAQEIDSLSRASRRLMRILESEDEPDAEIITRRRELQSDITVLQKRRDVLIRDRNALRRNAAANAHAVDEAVELFCMMTEATGTDLFVIRQKLHAILKQIIEVAEFDTMTGEAMVRIRGGLCLVVPLDKTTQAEAGVYRGGWNSFICQVTEGGIPPLRPSADGARLVS